ncbi:MerR family transcriptional regulator [Companilactobacillus farciminis]|nr:MerR family transcriptional regulator [Companilactobacillus farciminis]
MEQLFTIGQLSKLFNIKVPTLRYYDEVGLLKPAKINNKTHYRYYSTQQFERLNVITYLRALDLPIDAIKQFF